MRKDNNNEINQVLNLGSLHEEDIKEQKKLKLRGLPLFLIIIGILLIVSGFFYKDIVKFIKNDILKEDKNKVIVKKDDNVLTCTSSSNDQTIGLNKKRIKTYTFKDKKLKKLKVVTIYDVIENRSDIGTSNINLYNEKYSSVINLLQQVEGITSSSILKKNVLTVTVKYDLEKVDVKKIPPNDYIKLDNTFNEERRSVKKKEGEAGNICT